MSDINFSKLTWENLPARTTALSATNLNRIENGINDSVNGVNSNSHSIAELQTRISQMSGGVPPTASSTSGMNPEVSPIYVNTTDGNWYFWNGSAWTSGGTYGGAVTDTTLSISGAPADAKAVGDALALKADDTDVTALDTRVTAVEDDILELQDGGYVADQQKIAEKINDWFEDNPDRIPGGKVVTVSSSGAYRTVDDTYANILSAIASGRTVVVTDGGTTPYPYVGMMSQDGVPVLAFGVSATYNQTAVLSGYLIFDFDSNTRAIYVNQMTELYSKSEIDSMIGDIETLLASI